jgi:hypothetical protein
MNERPPHEAQLIAWSDEHFPTLTAKTDEEIMEFRRTYTTTDYRMCLPLTKAISIIARRSKKVPFYIESALIHLVDKECLAHQHDQSLVTHPAWYSLACSIAHRLKQCQIFNGKPQLILSVDPKVPLDFWKRDFTPYGGSKWLWETVDGQCRVYVSCYDPLTMTLQCVIYAVNRNVPLHYKWSAECGRFLGLDSNSSLYYSGDYSPHFSPFHYM